MSFYTVFDQKEPTVTSTTTSILQSSDPILIASSQQKHASQSTVGSISAQGTVTTVTTLTTGTNISPYGLSIINTTAGGNNVSWQLTDPPSAGICKTLFSISTTTTTPVTLLINFINASGLSTDVTVNSTAGIVTLTLGGGAAGALGGYFELQSLSTTQWAVVGRSAANSKTS